MQSPRQYPAPWWHARANVYHPRMRPVAAIAALAYGIQGCSLPARRADFNSTDPAERTLALGQAADDADRASIPDLIALLESEDSAERMLAINALEKKTGQRLGYDYADPDPARREAVERWVAWHQGGSGLSAPAAAGPHGQ